MAFYGRGKNRIQKPYTMPDFYKRYQDTHDELYQIEYSLYRDIVSEFYKEMMNIILLDAKTFKMPFRLGDIKVFKKKMSLKHLSARQMNWKETSKIGKRVYHLNEHSRGYKYMFRWKKKSHCLKNAFLYRFVPSRANKRELARLIKTGEYDYFEK